MLSWRSEEKFFVRTEEKHRHVDTALWKGKKNSYFELDVYNVLQNTYLFIYLRKKIPKCKVFVFGMYEIEIL